MLIIEIKDGEPIDKALKRYKRKFQNSGVMRELRTRKEFTKPSVQKRHKKLKAVYREKIRLEEENTEN
ncbi:MAG: 30S ribosomal protein S21 [Saprospiraceae bacterium]|nr:30S ribosomal protein S21 [Saprospiraceae bacterium]MDZ4703271.1 30S ribosomal protein S21 [Saprospiraceae bacterium]